MEDDNIDKNEAKRQKAINDPDTYIKRIITSNSLNIPNDLLETKVLSTIITSEEVFNPLTDYEKESLRKAFNKFDKKKTGSIKPTEIADVMRMAGQNPTLEQSEKMIAEADSSGTGMMMLSDLISIAEKYWRNPIIFEAELREACLAFDKKDLGTMEFEELKHALIKYGEQLDEYDLELMQKHMNASDGKIIVEEFIKTLLPAEAEPKKTKKGGKKLLTSAKRNKNKR